MNLLQQIRRVLARKAQVPPLEGFRRLVGIGLVDRQGRLDCSHVKRTTLRNLTRPKRKRTRCASKTP